MKYKLACFVVLMVTMALLLTIFHLLILPYIGPKGFGSMILTTFVTGLAFGTAAERLTERLYYHFHKE